MITVHPSPDAVADAVADLVADAVRARPRINIGLAGGSTPSLTYERLSGRDVTWDRVTLWLGDERWVPADHPDSNARMVRTTLGSGAERLIAPDHELGDPERAATSYATRLAAAFEPSGGHPDLVLLGMGDDGHTASLFPGTKGLDVMDRDYAAVWVADKNTWRLTATFPLLWSSERIVFVVTGHAKAPVVRRILEKGEPLPAQRVAEGAADVTWVLDQAAAAQLT